MYSYLSKCKVLGLDTETRLVHRTKASGPHLQQVIMLQIGDGTHQFVIDVRTHLKDIDSMKKILESDKILKVGMNLKFDYIQMFSTLGIYLHNVEDVMLNEMVMSCGIKRKRGYYSLEQISKRHLGYKFNNEKQLSLFANENFSKATRMQFLSFTDQPFTHSQVLYGANDVILPLLIRQKQREALKKEKLQKCADLENKLLPALSYIEICGFSIDKSKWLRNTKVSQEKLDFLKAQLQTYADINWNSHVQTSKFFASIGLDLSFLDDKTGETKTSVRKGIMEKYATNPIVEVYLHYKILQKVCSTYGESFLDFVNPVTGRIHSNYYQIVSTGRMSSSEVNMQNIPRSNEFRNCFVPRAAHVLIRSDYSQQEARVLASFANEPGMKALFASTNDDIHSFVASKIWNCEVSTEVNPELRSLGKTVNFAIAYGAGAHKIAQSAGISSKEAEKIIENYFKAFPQIKKYFAKAVVESHKNGYIKIDSITGRKSYINKFREFVALRDIVDDPYKFNLVKHQNKLSKSYSIKKGSIKRDTYNYPIQGCAASMTKLAIILLYSTLRSENLLGTVFINVPVHDEIVIEAPKALQIIAGEYLQNSMDKAFSAFIPDVASKMDLKFSKQ